MSCIGIDPTVETIRRTMDSSDISKETNRVGIRASMAALLAMLMAMAVFPMDGRAAMMASSPGWNPSVMRSRRGNPDVMPDSSPLRANLACVASIKPVTTDLEDRISSFEASTVSPASALETI